MIHRNLLTLISGGGIAQIITIMSLPLLGHLYNPENFGQLGAVMAVVSLATVLVHGRYQMAIPVAPSQDDAQALLVFSTLLSALLSTPAVVVIWVLFGDGLDGMSLWAFLFTVTLITFLSAVIDIFSFWRSHCSRFSISARNNIFRSAFTVLGQIGFSPITPMGLIAGTVLGSGIAVVLALHDFLKNDLSRLRMPSIRKLREIAYRYRSYPLYGVPQGWVAAVSWNAMPLLLLRFSGTQMAGLYWIAYRLLVAPVSLFNGAYRQSTLPILRGLSLQKSRALIAKHTILISVAGSIPLLILFFFGETLFQVTMGAAWQKAGVIAGWMAIGILGDLVKIPFICLLQSNKQQGQILAWEIMTVIVRYAASMPFLIKGEGIHAVAIFSSLGLACWLVFTLTQLFINK